MKIKIEFGEKKHDFFNLAKHEQNPQTRIRLMALGQLQKGAKIKDVAASIGFERKTVGHWYKAFKENGFAGLKNNERSGRKPKLKHEEAQIFLKEVEKLQEERTGGRITGEDIQELAKEKFDAHYAKNSIYTVLKRLNFVWITVRSKHPKSNQETQNNFKKTSFTR
jgi:transposase